MGNMMIEILLDNLTNVPLKRGPSESCNPDHGGKLKKIKDYNAHKKI